jgi:hypothetical protein
LGKPRRLLAHLRRWIAKGIVSEHFMEMERAASEVGEDRFQDRAALGTDGGDGSVRTSCVTRGEWRRQWEAAGFHWQ